MRRRRGMTTVRQPMMLGRIRRTNMWVTIRIVILIAAVAAGVLAIIFFGFPLIEDLVKGVDPSLRYQPKLEANFEEEEAPSKEQIDSKEVYTEKEYRLKNEPYIDGYNIIFTTQKQRNALDVFDSVAIYDTQSGETKLLEHVEKKYDKLVSPVLSGNIAVYIDSNDSGGGRILGYDLEKNEQFVIKEFAYAQPQLAISGERLAFMQWAGETTQRIYVYNVKTREAATVKLYEKGDVTCGDVDISDKDMVWAEKDKKGNSVLKRIVFNEDGTSQYENYNFGNAVYNPKTNGTNIVFKTERYSIASALMSSTQGAEPAKLADSVFDYGIGNDFVAYSKNGQIYVAHTNSQATDQVSSDITLNLLASVNGNALCYYDLTDKQVNTELSDDEMKYVVDDVVKYAYVSEH